MTDLGQMLANEKFSDITLIARDGCEFKAHKVILSGRSEVFDTMLRSDFVEAKTNRITIDDMDAEVMKEMLTFIYTGKGIHKEMAYDLFSAANKYALMDLETMCENILTKSMDVSSVADIILLADLNSNERLKSRALQFIKGNVKEVMKAESWKKLRASNLELCVEILETVCS
ncbi:speckle-type POZ protein-like [Musca autumnalis]|uniref:speckle-type POZ protein-like n=1 Tax=Musca autumnalis TaxID=221902 RepID=UPI003CE88063